MRARATTMGLNRTGIGTSPIDSDDIIKTAREACPPSATDGHAVAALRREYDSESEPVGTVPIPTTLKGALKGAMDALRGRKVTAFVDKLGERLAFERTSTRLYEAILSKHDAMGTWSGGPTRAELEQIHDEELAHVDLVRATIEGLGADPTAETPAADVAGVASSGLLLVATDPRTSLAQSLSAVLAAELCDNDGWQMLACAARAAGKDDLVSRFEKAMEVEARHLASVRVWLRADLEPSAKAEG